MKGLEIILNCDQGLMDIFIVFYAKFYHLKLNKSQRIIKKIPAIDHLCKIEQT